MVSLVFSPMQLLQGRTNAKTKDSTSRIKSTVSNMVSSSSLIPGVSYLQSAPYSKVNKLDLLFDELLMPKTQIETMNCLNESLIGRKLGNRIPYAVPTLTKPSLGSVYDQRHLWEKNFEEGQLLINLCANLLLDLQKKESTMSSDKATFKSPESSATKEMEETKTDIECKLATAGPLHRRDKKLNFKHRDSFTMNDKSTQPEKSRTNTKKKRKRCKKKKPKTSRPELDEENHLNSFLDALLSTGESDKNSSQRNLVFHSTVNICSEMVAESILDESDEDFNFCDEFDVYFKGDQVDGVCLKNVVNCQNSSIAFILNGNEDLLESEEDSYGEDYWLELDDSEEDERVREELEVSDEEFHSSVLQDDGNSIESIEVCLSKVNRKWDLQMKDFNQLAMEQRARKVHFASDENLVAIRRISASKEERKCLWDQFGLDRCRFNKRIQEMEAVIAPCFEKELREKIFSERFKN